MLESAALPLINLPGRQFQSSDNSESTRSLGRTALPLQHSGWLEAAGPFRYSTYPGHTYGTGSLSRGTAAAGQQLQSSLQP